MKRNYIYLFLIAFFSSYSAIAYADQDKAYLNKKLLEQNQVLIWENKTLKKNIEALSKQIKNLIADNQNNNSFNRAPSDSLALNGKLTNKSISIKPNRNGFASFSDHFLKEQLAYQDTQIKILTDALQREKLKNARELSFSPASSFIISASGSSGIEKPVSYYDASFSINNQAQGSSPAPFAESSMDNRIQRTEESLRIHSSVDNHTQRTEESLQIESLAEELRSVREQIAELTGTSVERQHGQTPVWTSLDSITFIHTAFLKSQPPVSDEPLKEILRELKRAYDEIMQEPAVIAVRGTSKFLFRRSMDQLDPEDTSSFQRMLAERERIINFTTGRPLLAALGQVFERAREAYARFQGEQQQRIPELDTYVSLQRKFEDITRQVPVDDFRAFMTEFDSRKKQFIRTMMNFVAQPNVDSTSFYPLLDKISFEMSGDPLEVFNKAFKERPTDARRDHPFILLVSTGKFKVMQDLNFYERHNRAGIRNNPLSDHNPFTLLKQTLPTGGLIAREPDLSFIDDVEKMYIFQHSQRLFSTSHWSDEPLRTRIGQEALLSQNVKNTLSSLLEPDRRFLQRELATHALTLKKLDEELKPVLSYSQTASWAGKEDFRETLSNIYTHYRNMVTIGSTLYKKYPKIREFHEEE